MMIFNDINDIMTNNENIIIINDNDNGDRNNDREMKKYDRKWCDWYMMMIEKWLLFWYSGNDDIFCLPDGIHDDIINY